MVVIGVTGMIASGKSTISSILKEEYGAIVFDSDKVAKDIIKKHNIDNTKVIGNPMKLYQIEQKVHPYFIEEMQQFIKDNSDSKYIIIDIPLLFEIGLEKYCDVSINVFCNFDARVQRAQKRMEMSIEKFVFLNNKQMNDDARNSKATFVISTDKDMKEVKQDLKVIMEKIDAGNYTGHRNDGI